MPPEVAAEFWRDRREHVGKVRREMSGLSYAVLSGRWTLDSYAPRTESERRAVALVRDWVAGALPQRWLLLYGDIGTGKSGLAQCGIMESLPYCRAQYVTRIDLVSDVQAGFKRENATEADCLEHWVALPRLAIDDLDKGRVTEYVCKTLWAVVDGRLRADRETILTCNGDLEGLYQYLAIPGCETTADSIVDRIRGACASVRLTGGSRR